MIFITNQVSKGLQVDKELNFGDCRQQTTHMEVMEDERRGERKHREGDKK